MTFNTSCLINDLVICIDYLFFWTLTISFSYFIKMYRKMINKLNKYLCLLVYNNSCVITLKRFICAM